MGTEGDSFFVAFQDAWQAVAAATKAQREMTSHVWPADEPVRVRIGVHTGTPTIFDDGYIGMDVHRCARVASAAHGGQIVISAATADLVVAALPKDVVLVDLGYHQLKDLPAPERLYQVSAHGLPATFPPLKSLGAATRLPAPATPLVGRQAELARVVSLLLHEGARLVTLTGPGGAGKTRLAVEVGLRHAIEFPGGVHFVMLANDRTAAQMWSTLATTLGLAPNDRPEQLGTGHLGDLPMLIVLDNLEQIHEADTLVAALLRTARHLVVLATSRRPLHLPEEHDYPIQPLSLPPEASLSSAQASPAVELFLQQARRVRPTFELTEHNAADIVAACRRLDGLPLALEIAAARMKLFSPRALSARLEDTLDLPATGRGTPHRHHTLRDTIAWSYDLLSPELREAFAALGVFAGGADLGALAAVLVDPSGRESVDALETVTGLLDASLITVTEDLDGEPRVGLLEHARAFAREALVAAGTLDEIHLRHAEHYLGVLDTVAPALVGAHTWTARDRLDTERDNLRQALRWALDATTADQGPGEGLALRLCVGLGHYWDLGAHYVEARDWLEEAVGQTNDASPSLARCLGGLAIVHSRLGDTAECRRWAGAAVDMCREADFAGETLARALRVTALAPLLDGDTQVAISRLEEAFEALNDAGDSPIRHRILGDLAIASGIAGNLHRSLELLEKAIPLAQACNEFQTVGLLQLNRASVLRDLGRTAEAHAETITLISTLLHEGHPRDLVLGAESLAEVLLDLDSNAAAVALLGAADATRARTGYARDWAQEAAMQDAFHSARRSMSGDEWHDAYRTGRETPIAILLRAQADSAGQSA